MRNMVLRAGMTHDPDGMDAHAKPAPAVKAVYKTFQRLDTQSLDGHHLLLDLENQKGAGGEVLKPCSRGDLSAELRQVFLDFLDTGDTVKDELEVGLDHKITAFEVAAVPGLFIYPSLLPPQVQLSLLDKLFHRDLSNPEHKTNVHMHYNNPYPSLREDGSALSYFDLSSTNLTFQPKDPTIHKAIDIKQFLDKKLRWTTLGGQYDWTNKVYPAGPPPPFPSDIKQLIERIFPMKAEAAIVNLYSPGDTLSLHRDVSEECDQPLVSISLGCDGIFVIGLNDTDDRGEPRVATIRLRSGDAVLMSGESRYAWHGVPKVMKGTCPIWMQDWPFHKDAGDGANERFERWKGWMKGKRVNLNVRQMFA